jgi:DNA-directed RNA polymerase specialized sigma24 family protein
MSNKKLLEDKIKKELPDIVKKIKDGDSSAKEDFSVLLLPYIRFLIKKFANSLDKAEELDSLANLITVRLLYLKLDKIDMSKSFVGYICRTVNNYCIDEIIKTTRKKRKAKLVSEVYLNNVGVSEPQFSPEFEIQSSFTKEDSEIIELFFLQDKTYKEISVLTGRPITQIKSTIEESIRVYRDSQTLTSD